MLKDDIKNMMKHLKDRQEIDDFNNSEHLKQFPKSISGDFLKGYKQGYRRSMFHVMDYLTYLLALEKENVGS